MKTVNIKNRSRLKYLLILPDYQLVYLQHLHIVRVIYNYAWYQTNLSYYQFNYLRRHVDQRSSRYIEFEKPKFKSNFLYFKKV